VNLTDNETDATNKKPFCFHQFFSSALLSYCIVRSSLDECIVKKQQLEMRMGRQAHL